MLFSIISYFLEIASISHRLSEKIDRNLFFRIILLTIVGKWGIICPRTRKGYTFMKKWLAILLALSAVILLPSCGDKTQSSSDDDGKSSSSGSKKKGTYTYVTQEVDTFYNESENRSTVFVNGKAIETTIDGTVYVDQASLDNSVSVIVTSDFDYYILNGTDLVKNADSDKWQNVILSSDGKGVAYTVHTWYDSTIYLYDVDSKQSTTAAVAEDLVCTAVSPDGKSLTYVVGNDDGKYTGYFFDGKKTVELGKNVIPLGLSDGGKFIYTETYDDENDTYVLNLYSNSGEKKNKIGHTDEIALHFNEKHTEMLYVCDGKCYISVNGAEGTRFFKESAFYLINPEDTHRCYDEYGITYPVTSFYNRFYYSNGGIYQAKDNYEENLKLAAKVSEYGTITISRDESTIYYQSVDDDLKMVKTSWGEKGPEKVVTIAEDVNHYAVTSDLRRVYYTQRDELYRADAKNGESKKLIANVVDYYIFLGKGDILYFVKAGDLFACSNGESATLVLSDPDDITFGFLGYFYFESDGTIYCATGSEKPEKIFDLG